MFERFYPDEWMNSTYDIDFESLYAEGYRGLIFDIDNTLVPHGAPADERAIGLFKRLKEIGFSCCLLSNNTQKRVKMFNQDIGVSYIYMGNKPSKSGYERAMKKTGTNLQNTVFVGDQLFTDVWGAKRMGMRNILVKPINPKEDLHIIIKRKLEQVVLKRYIRHKKTH